MKIDTLLAKRIRDLRRSRSLALDKLAEQSGVSRSMISLIEREETSPTAAVLDKLAGALGVTLASLFSAESQSEEEQPLARHAEQQVWTDPASGYVRRHLSPGGHVSPIELAEVTFPPGQIVTFDNVPRNVVTHQQIWMLDGEMEITLGEKRWRLETGDCLAMVLGPDITFRNPTSRPARYALALTSSLPISRRT